MGVPTPRCIGLPKRFTPLVHGQTGFTLIEVLAALIIVSLGLLGVIEAVSQTASNSTYLRDKTLAHWVAMNQLTKTRLEAQPPKLDQTSDEIEMAERRWRWTMKITQSPLDSVRRIDVSVRLADAAKDSSLASVTGFYGSAVAPPGTIVVMWQGSPTEQSGGGEEGGKNGDKKNPRDPNNPNDPNRPNNPSNPSNPGNPSNPPPDSDPEPAPDNGDGAESQQ